MKKNYMKPEVKAESIALTEVIALSTLEGNAESTDTPLVKENDETWGDLW